MFFFPILTVTIIIINGLHEYKEKNANPDGIIPYFIEYLNED